MALRMNKGSWLLGIGSGVGVGIAITLIGALAGAWMLSTGILDEEAMGYVCVLVWLVGSVGGSLVSASLAKSNILPICMLTGAGLYVVLLLANFGFYGRGLEGILPGLGVILGGSGAACLLLSRPARRRSARTRRRKTG